MENIEQKPVRTNDEIDLIELFSRMWNGLKESFFLVLNQLQNLIILIIRKFIWILIFASAGMAYSFIMHVAVEDFYFSEASFRSNGIANSHVIDFINQFESLISNRNHDAIAERLGIESEKAKSIKSLGAFYGLDINRDRVIDYIDYENTYDPLDTMMARLPVMVYVKIELWQAEHFSAIKKSIIDYVSKNPFIITNNNIRLRQAEEQILSIDLEIKKLDSLQRLQYFDVPKTQRASTNQMLVLNEKEMKLYHDILLGLKNRKQGLEKELELYSEPITIMQPFTELSVESDRFGLRDLLSGAMFGIVGFIISLFWQYRVSIHNAIRTKES